MVDAAGSRRSVTTLCATAVTMLIVDIATKALAVGLIPIDRPITILGDRVAWVVERNAGGALSIGQDHTWVFTALVATVVCVVSWCARRADSLFAAFGAGLFLGGALGNLGDRVFRAPGHLEGHVVDFVAIGGWPVFNAADVGIACGAVILGWRAATRRPLAEVSAPPTGWSWDYRPAQPFYGRGVDSSKGIGMGRSIKPLSAASPSSGGTGRVGMTIVGR